MPAVEYIAVAVPASTTNTTSFTLTIPASTQTGDVLLVCAVSRDATGSDPGAISDNDTGGNSWNARWGAVGGVVKAWTKIATSGSANKTITVSDMIGSSTGFVLVARGADANAGFTDAMRFNSQFNSSGTEECASRDTTRRGGSLIGLVNVNHTNDLSVSSQAAENLGNLSERAEHLNTGGSDCSIVVATGTHLGQGPTGLFTYSQTNANNYALSFEIIAAVALRDVIGQGIIPVAR